MVRAELPGVPRERVNVEVDGRELHIARGVLDRLPIGVIDVVDGGAAHREGHTQLDQRLCLA